MPNLLRYTGALALALALVLAAARGAGATTAEVHPGQRAFAVEVARQAARPGLDAAAIEAVLAQARFQQSIIDAISRPAEKTKPWRDYRPIFLTPQRTAQGLEFWRENAPLLDRASAEFGVPPEIIVAIIGVETSYGRITGRYRVLDALVTLAFYYPPRAEFFRKELAQLFLLQGDAFPYALDEVMGSYAGAMGWGQFMPSSIASYARSYDADPRIDLWASRADVIASVANYFAAHGWETGAPVARPARVAASARRIAPADLEPVYSVAQLEAWGYAIEGEDDPERAATLLRLDGAQGEEYWVTHRNFWVISRYNRSPLYSMAVWQLSQELAAGMRGAAAP